MGIENLDIKSYKEIVQNAAELTSGKLVQERQVQRTVISDTTVILGWKSCF